MRRLACAIAVGIISLTAPLRSAGAADLKTDPKKTPVEYSARPEPPPGAGEVLVWIPRVILSPVWLVHEYGLRKPLGALIKAKPEGGEGEPDSFPELAPSLHLDLGFRPWVGLYASWKPRWALNHDFLGHVAFGGVGAMTEAFADRIRTSHGVLTLRQVGTSRDDGLFHGLGPTTAQADAHRYGYDRFEAGPSFDMPLPARNTHLIVASGVRAMRFRDAGCCLGNPSLPSAESYTAIYERVVLGVDSRSPIPGRSFGEPPSRSGIRAAIEAEADFDVAHRARSWARYGAVISGYWDINYQRVLSLTVNAQLADPLGGGASGVPFTEQASLGGDAPMQGFRTGRLTGRSATAATLAFEWPIWLWLAGVVDVSVGNVFGAHLRGFDPELLRFSSTVGAHVLASNDHYFQVLTGFGTQPLANGFKAESFRLTFGMTRRF